MGADVVVMRANSFGESVRAVWDLLRDAPTADGAPVEEEVADAEIVDEGQGA